MLQENKFACVENVLVTMIFFNFLFSIGNS